MCPSSKLGLSRPVSVAFVSWHYLNLLTICVCSTQDGPEVWLTTEDDEGSGEVRVCCAPAHLTYLEPYATLLSEGERPAVPVELRDGVLHFSIEGAAYDHPGVDLGDLVGLASLESTRMG